MLTALLQYSHFSSHSHCLLYCFGLESTDINLGSAYIS